MEWLARYFALTTCLKNTKVKCESFSQKGFTKVWRCHCSVPAWAKPMRGSWQLATWWIAVYWRAHLLALSGAQVGTRGTGATDRRFPKNHIFPAQHSSLVHSHSFLSLFFLSLSALKKFPGVLRHCSCLSTLLPYCISLHGWLFFFLKSFGFTIILAFLKAVHFEFVSFVYFILSIVFRLSSTVSLFLFF